MTTVATTPAAELPVRIGPLKALQHGMTLTWRRVISVKNSPEQLLDVVIQPIVIIVLFVFVFGGAVSNNWQDYLQFVLPGMMVQTVFLSTMGIGVTMSTDVSKGISDRFRSLPIARSAPLVGTVLGEAGRYLISIAVLIGFSAVLGYRFENGLLGTLAACAVVLVFSFGLCWIPALVGLLVKNPQTVQGLGFVVMFPLTFISNVFVKTSTMPEWMQAWVRISPVTQVVNATRGLMNGGPVAGPILYSAAWGIGILLVFAPLTVRAYLRRS
ncbi:ABC transporter permease [Amycolatopsis sp. NPDC059090]|uniref:ABC transporter permease n=1 Tax=unclassified Amycolatopsis TaxID=2618356 RepID=UPI003672CD32